MNKYFFAFIIFFTAPFAQAQEAGTHTVVKSLDTDWQVYSNGQFQSYNPKSDAKPRAIYFSLEANKYHGDFLKCSANGTYSLFINHQLINITSGTTLLNLDSLSAKISSTLQCVIFQREGIQRLTTQIVKPVKAEDEPALMQRKASYFFDFSIIASFFMLAYFIVLIRTLPRLATNYFNVLRLVSLQEREENLAGSRVSSTANILFYVFGSLLAGLMLTVIFYYGSGDASSPMLSVDSKWDGFVQWFKWSTFVLMVFFFKLVLTFLLSSLFNIGEFVPFHFFNFLRMHFFAFGACTLLCLGYFIFKGQNPEFYSYLLYGFAILSFFWVVLIYLKLLNRVPFRFFHLFSYLCVSEIIPMVIIFKILLF
jgi:hypothetical protein